MTHGRDLQLEWAQHEGRDCLRITGWAEAELDALGETGCRGVVPASGPLHQRSFAWAV